MSNRETQLIDLITAERRVMELLEAVRSLGLGEWCIAAGTIRNLVWDHLHAFKVPTLPSDVDVLIFDQGGPEGSDEHELEHRLSLIVPHVEWEVVNQATVHLYTGDRTAYVSIWDAMSRWADLVTAVGARLHDDGRLEIIAPGGLDDLFELRVRPNIVTPTAAAVYRRRIATKPWIERWPLLTIEELPE